MADTAGTASRDVDHAATRAIEQRLVRSLREGDERAFSILVDRYHLSLLRFARARISDPAVAEELVQDTWLALVQGIHRFEGRSTLRTWLFHVLMYRINERQRRQKRLRALPFEEEHVVDPERFRDADDRLAGHWATPPASWDSLPDERVAEQELIEQIRRLVDDLSPRQRAVVILRDIEGLSASDVCDVLDITDGSERVLLHRARARIRNGLELYLNGERDHGD
jgi:RNA polymerase sigma-70 factor (ECF subfamily)